MYKEACVLLKRAGWWDDVKTSTKNAWNDFNDYADKNEWVRPAVGAGLLGLGGAGVGALTGGAKGAAIGGGAGLTLGALGGRLMDTIPIAIQIAKERARARSLDYLGHRLKRAKKDKDKDTINKIQQELKGL